VKAFAPNDVWAAGWQEITGSGQFFGPEILAMHWDGAQWSIVPTPIPGASVGGLSGANGSHVTAIDGVAPDDVWFVGLWMQPVPAGTFLETGLAMHWDGAQMTVYPTPYAQGPSGFTGGYILNDVLAFASNDVWAVGNGLNTWTPVPYVLRWDGVQWDLVDVPLVEPWFQFHEIVGTSSSNLFISGSVRDANFVETRVLLHFDGSNWTQQPTPPFGPSSLYMAPTGVLYATSFGIDRFENGTWTHVADVTTNQQQPLVGSIDGFGECELYVVGSKTTVNLGTRPFSARLFPDLWSDLGGGAVGATGVPTLTGKGAPIAGEHDPRVAGIGSTEHACDDVRRTHAVRAAGVRRDVLAAADHPARRAADRRLRRARSLDRLARRRAIRSPALHAGLDGRSGCSVRRDGLERTVAADPVISVRAAALRRSSAT
jgi:hypothetical protein